MICLLVVYDCEIYFGNVSHDTTLMECDIETISEQRAV